MLGLMQDRPLSLPHVFHRAEQYFGHKTIVTRALLGSDAGLFGAARLPMINEAKR